MDDGRYQEAVKRAPQTVAFVAAGALLAAVLYTSFAVQGNRRLQEQARATATAQERALTTMAPQVTAAAHETARGHEVQVLHSTPVAVPGEPITPENAGRLRELARWGKGVINSIAWSPDGRLQAVGTSLGVYLYDAQTGAEVRLLETRAQVGSCAFSPDGRTLAAVVNSDILLWRVAGGLIEHTVHGTFTAFSQISYSAAGSLQVAWWSHEAQGLFLWRDGVQTSLPEARGSPDSPESSPADLAFSPDGRLLAAGTSEGMLYLLQVSDGAAVAVAPAQTSRVSGVAFSPHGQVLAIVSGDGTVRL